MVYSIFLVFTTLMWGKQNVVCDPFPMILVTIYYHLELYHYINRSWNSEGYNTMVTLIVSPAEIEGYNFIVSLKSYPSNCIVSL